MGPNGTNWRPPALLCTAFFMAMMDSSIVLVALPSIDGDLAFHAADLQWVMSAYMLSFGGLLLGPRDRRRPLHHAGLHRQRPPARPQSGRPTPPGAQPAADAPLAHRHRAPRRRRRLRPRLRIRRHPRRHRTARRRRRPLDAAAPRVVLGPCQRQRLLRQPRPGARLRRLVPTRANGQPAAAHYTWREDVGAFLPHAIQVLALSADARLSEITVFVMPEAFPRFGLPERLEP
jgi:hypothetical protein